MVNDLYLFDPVTNKFTVERYIKGKNKLFFQFDAICLTSSYACVQKKKKKDAEKRYGTIDSVVVSLLSLFFMKASSCVVKIRFGQPHPTLVVTVVTLKIS